MIKKFTLLLAITLSSYIIAQQKETCESPVEEALIDTNSITKCSIEEKQSDDSSNKRTKTVTVQVSSRRRVKRNRKAVSSNLNELKSNDISSTKTDSDIAGNLNLTDKNSIKSSYLSKEKVIEKVPFNHVEESPLLDACKKVSILEQKKCVHKEINKHIIKNFNYPKEAYSKNIQGRVLVQFVIDKTGDVTDLNIRLPYKGDLLEAESRRIIESLPKFTPGKHNGEAVKVKYGVPINFKIPGRKPSNVKTIKKDVKLDEVHNFMVVDQIPTFKKCEASNNNSEDCFNKLFVQHINKNFSYPQEAINNNVEGKVIAYFVINSEGEVVNVKTRAASGKEVLEKATKELIEKLPNFIPGKHKGKVTNVRHAFPVNFNLE